MIEIIKMTLKKSGLKTKEFVSELNVSERTIKENIKMLVDSKIIFYEGSNKTGGYYLEKDIINKIQP